MSQKSISVILKITQDSSRYDIVLTLPKKICDSLKEPDAKIKVGMAEKYIKYEPKDKISYDCFMYNATEEYIKYHSNSTDNTVEISSDVAESLGLSQGMITNLIIKDNKVCLGPVMGIFVSNCTIRKANIQKPSFRLIELWRANKDSNLMTYYFSIKDVNFVNKRINGTYYDEEKQIWCQKSFPFPEILYDRRGGSLKNQKVTSKYIRTQLCLNEDFKKVNYRHFFDKWDVYEQLVKHEDMKVHLPFTILYKEPEDLIEMFHKSSIIYIKGCYGSTSRLVTRVIRSGEESYHLSYFHEGVVEYELRSLKELVDQIKTIFQNKKIILQCAVDVIEIDDCPIEMKATVQRNGSGELGVYAHPVILGQKKFSIESTKSDSTVYMFEDFFTKYYNYTKEQITDLKTKINEMLMKIFLYTESAYDNFGELDIDFAIDKKGDVWFIKCNARPRKAAIYLSYDKDTIKRGFQNPLEYAKYICGF